MGIMTPENQPRESVSVPRERLSSLEANYASLKENMSEVKAQLDHISKKLDEQRLFFLPAHEAELRFQSHSELIQAQQLNSARIENEFKSELKALNQAITSELHEIKEDLRSEMKNRIQKNEDERIARKRNMPHWLYLIVAVVSLGVAIVALTMH